METTFKIWRETAATAKTVCSAYPQTLRSYEVVRFDEDENAEAFVKFDLQIPIIPRPQLAATSRIASDRSDLFAPNTSEAIAGWIYLNPDNGCTPVRALTEKHWGRRKDLHPSVPRRT